MKHIIAALLLLLYAIPTVSKEIEKKGYIITNTGDTIYGKVFLKTEFGKWNGIQLFDQVRFADSSGEKKTYKPGEIRGYGIALAADSIFTHFISFLNVEMSAAFGSKRENTFLLREMEGRVEVYHLLHIINSGISNNEVPELYLRQVKDSVTLARIKPKALKIPMRYRKSDILPYLDDWPETEHSKIHDELSPFEVMECVVTYNRWWEKTNKNFP
jgi:hypothetical protein